MLPKYYFDVAFTIHKNGSEIFVVIDDDDVYVALDGVNNLFFSVGEVSRGFLLLLYIFFL